VLELGAGDGTLMLGVARALAPVSTRVELTLLDRQDLVEAATRDAYAALGWTVVPRVVDVCDWIANGADERWDLIVANLFLHHFEGEALHALLAACAARSDRFFACEPRRARLALGASHLVGFIGANAVTREDAVLSVHAGFRDAELSAAWPHAGGWQLHERPAALFSHCFSATRVG
jgi:predicted nicotinamide N-methyase